MLAGADEEEGGAYVEGRPTPFPSLLAADPTYRTYVHLHTTHLFCRQEEEGTLAIASSSFRPLRPSQLFQTNSSRPFEEEGGAVKYCKHRKYPSFSHQDFFGG